MILAFQKLNFFLYLLMECPIDHWKNIVGGALARWSVCQYVIIVNLHIEVRFN